jgi:hypothetical protein
MRVFYFGTPPLPVSPLPPLTHPQQPPSSKTNSRLTARPSRPPPSP